MVKKYTGMETYSESYIKNAIKHIRNNKIVQFLIYNKLIQQNPYIEKLIKPLLNIQKGTNMKNKFEDLLDEVADLDYLRRERMEIYRKNLDRDPSRYEVVKLTPDDIHNINNAIQIFNESIENCHYALKRIASLHTRLSSEEIKNKKHASKENTQLLLDDYEKYIKNYIKSLIKILSFFKGITESEEYNLIEDNNIRIHLLNIDSKKTTAIDLNKNVTIIYDQGAYNVYSFFDSKMITHIKEDKLKQVSTLAALNSVAYIKLINDLEDKAYPPKKEE